MFTRGHYGGAIANPINVLCKLIADATNEDGRILFPGFYDKVEEASEDERKMLASIPLDLEGYKKSIEVDELFGEKGYSTLERTGFRPSFDVCRYLGRIHGRWC